MCSIIQFPRLVCNYSTHMRKCTCLRTSKTKQASRITSFETVLGHVRLVGSGSRSTGSTGFAPFRLVESGSFGFGSRQPTSGSGVARTNGSFFATTTAHLAGPNPRECLSSRLAQQKFGCFIPLLFFGLPFQPLRILCWQTALSGSEIQHMEMRNLLDPWSSFPSGHQQSTGKFRFLPFVLRSNSTHSNFGCYCGFYHCGSLCGN